MVNIFEQELARRSQGGSDVGAIDLSRPKIENPEGTFSTEETITIDIETPEGKRFFNIPTIVNGQRVSEDEAVRLFRSGENQAVGEFTTLEEALDVARRRSDEIGRIRNTQNPFEQELRGRVTPEDVQAQVSRETKDIRLPPTRDLPVGAALQEAIQGEQLAASQGVQPTVRDPVTGELEFPMRGEFVQFDGQNMLRDPEGNLQPINPETDLVLIDPLTGERAVFARTEAQEEPKILSAFRLLAPGFAVGPAATRATRGAVQAARARTLSAGEVSKVAQNLERSQRVAQKERILRAAEGAGVTPSAALVQTVPGEESVGTVTNVIAKTPFIGTSTQKALQANVDEIQQGVTRVAGQVGRSLSADEAGSVIQTAVQRFDRAREIAGVTDESALVLPSRSTSFARKQQALYSRLDRLIPDDTRVALTNAKNVVQKLRSKIGVDEFDRIFRVADLDELAQAIDTVGPVDWEAARTIRTRIRELGKGQDVLSKTIDDADINAIYSAFTKDLQNAARNVSPQALGAMVRADKFTRAGKDRINTVLKEVFGKRQARTFEQSFKQFTDSLRTTGGDVRKIQALKRSLKNDEFNDLVATTLSNLGRPVASAADPTNAADFSINTFLTNYNKISPKARNILMSGANSEIRKQLDDLIEIGNARKNVEKLVNPSRSGVFANTAAFLGGSFFDLGSAAAAALTGSAVGKLMTNPKFIKWLVRMERARLPQSKVAQTPGLARSFLNQSIAQLRLIGTQEPEFAPAIEEFMTNLDVHMQAKMQEEQGGR